LKLARRQGALIFLPYHLEIKNNNNNKLTWRYYLSLQTCLICIFVSQAPKSSSHCLTPLLSMQSKGWQGQWFCRSGALWPLEDKWSIFPWETLRFAASQQNTVPKWTVLQVANPANAPASGLGTVLKLFAICPHCGELQEMPSKNINHNVHL